MAVLCMILVSWRSIVACFPIQCLVLAFLQWWCVMFNRFGPSGLLLLEGFKPTWHFAADVAWDWSKNKRCLLGSNGFRVDFCAELLDCVAFLLTVLSGKLTYQWQISNFTRKCIFKWFVFCCDVSFFWVNSASRLPGTPAIEPVYYIMIPHGVKVQWFGLKGNSLMNIAV